MGALFGPLVVLPILASAVTGACVLGWQGLHWLQHATWPEMTLRDGLVWWYGPSARLETGWQGANKIVRESPLTLWLLAIVPTVWTFVGIFFFERVFKLVTGKRA